jgi:hypothetical protein
MADRYNSKIAKALSVLYGYPVYAITVSSTTTWYSCTSDEVSRRMRKHEDQHKVQYAQLGRINFWIEYMWESALFGYNNNRFEIEARAAEGPITLYMSGDS